MYVVSDQKKKIIQFQIFSYLYKGLKNFILPCSVTISTALGTASFHFPLNPSRIQRNLISELLTALRLYSSCIFSSFPTDNGSSSKSCPIKSIFCSEEKELKSSVLKGQAVDTSQSTHLCFKSVQTYFGQKTFSGDTFAQRGQ